MKIQRLRNLTTGRLHTKMEDIYKDIEFLVGTEGLFTHQLRSACDAMMPWLKEKIKEERFWDDQYDTTHIGEYDISPMNEKEKKEFWQAYGSLPSSLEGLGKNNS